MEKIISCGAVIEDDNNNILIIKQLNGVVGFPKGHKEKGESDIETAIREVKEETGVDIIIDKNICFKITYTTPCEKNKEAIYFLAHPKNSTKLIKQESEIEELYWVNKDEVRDMLSFDNLKEGVWDKIYKFL